MEHTLCFTAASLKAEGSRLFDEVISQMVYTTYQPFVNVGTTTVFLHDIHQPLNFDVIRAAQANVQTLLCYTMIHNILIDVNFLSNDVWFQESLHRYNVPLLMNRLERNHASRV
jgi:hypothetical protein